MNKSQRDPWLLLPPVAFGALSAGYIVIAKGFTNQTSAAAPLLYGEAMAALSVLAFLVALVRGRPANSEDGEAARTTDLGRAILIHGLTAGAVLGVLLGGLYAGIPLFLFWFLWRLAHVRVLYSAAAGLAFAAFIWLGFGYLLNLQVYQGYLAFFQN